MKNSLPAIMACAVCAACSTTPDAYRGQASRFCDGDQICISKASSKMADEYNSGATGSFWLGFLAPAAQVQDYRTYAKEACATKPGEQKRDCAEDMTAALQESHGEGRTQGFVVSLVTSLVAVLAVAAALAF